VLPFAVPPREAARLLSISLTRLYELMRAGELVSYRDGRARRITTASIHQRMARQIADSAEKWHPLNPQPPQASKTRK
jgi:excisionase family DNA binding protein